MDTFLDMPPAPTGTTGNSSIGLAQAAAVADGLLVQEKCRRLMKALEKLADRTEGLEKARIAIAVWPAVSTRGQVAMWVTARMEFQDPAGCRILEERELAEGLDDLERGAKDLINRLAKQLTKEGIPHNGN